MALKAILDSLDGIDESLHGFYTEKNGKFILQVEGVDAHPAVVALKNGHTNSKRERDEARAELRTLKERYGSLPDDFDADEYTRLKSEEEARLADPDNKDLQSKINAATTAVKTQLEAKLDRQKRDADAKLAEKDAEITKRDAEIRRRVVTDGLRTALTEANVKPGLLAGAVAMFDRDVEVVLEDDQYVARMKSDLGGDEVAKFIGNWAQTDAAKDFIATAAGPDVQGNNRRGGGADSASNPFGKAGWNKTTQAAMIRDNRAKAEQLAKAAGFKSLDQTYAARGPVAA